MQLEESGIERESREFTPHITIGRQVILNKEFNKLVERINIDTIGILVNKISLMESIRIGGELKYIPIYIRNFK